MVGYFEQVVESTWELIDNEEWEYVEVDGGDFFSSEWEGKGYLCKGSFQCEFVDCSKETE